MKRSGPLRRVPLERIKASLDGEQAAEGTARHRRVARRRDDRKWRKDCLTRYGTWCRACGDTRHPQTDHMIPRSQGGPSVVENCVILGGPFGCGCHDRKTAHTLLIQREWLTRAQVWWLEAEGHAWWLPDGTVAGRHCVLFATVTV